MFRFTVLLIHTFSYRILNLELLNDFGNHTWKNYNDLLVKMMEQSQKQLAEFKYVYVS
mgnify:FL=1